MSRAQKELTTRFIAVWAFIISLVSLAGVIIAAHHTGSSSWSCIESREEQDTSIKYWSYNGTIAALTHNAQLFEPFSFAYYGNSSLCTRYALTREAE